MKIEELAEQLGMTEEALGDRIVNQIVSEVLRKKESDPEDGYEYEADSEFAKSLRQRVRDEITAHIDRVAQESMAPKVEDYLKDFAIRQTNRYGEQKGEPLTVTEFIAAECERWVNEPVDFDGKTKDQAYDKYRFTGKTTRLGFMIHKYLHYTIEGVMKDAIDNANSKLVQALEETAKMQLARIAKTLSVSVKTKD